MEAAPTHAISPRLTYRCKEVLNLIRILSRKEGYCWASQKYMAYRLEMTVRTLKRHLRTLRILELITTEKQGRENVYSVTEQGTNRGQKQGSNRGQNVPYSVPYDAPKCPLSENVQYRDELKEREYRAPPPTISEIPRPADTRLDFWEVCQLNRNEGQTDEFILGWELIANYRTWNRPNDPQMFMAIWWKKFRKCKPGDFRQAVENYIESTGTPFDRAGVADWLQKSVWKDKEEKSKLPEICKCGKGRIDGPDNQCYRCRKPSFLKEPYNMSEPKKANQTLAKSEPIQVKESDRGSEPKRGKESDAPSEPVQEKQTRNWSESKRQKLTAAQVMAEWLEP